MPSLAINRSFDKLRDDRMMNLPPEPRPIPDPKRTTLSDLLRARAGDCGDSPFAVFPERVMTYAEADREARQVARSLVAMGVRPGDHVAVLMPNCPQWVPACFGALYAGAVVVALNARYKQHELAYTIEHSDARILLTTDAIDEYVPFADLIARTFPDIVGQADAESLALEGAPRLKSVVIVGRAEREGFLSFDSFMALGEGVADDRLAGLENSRTANDVAMLMYTSGTTSNPKACALTHAGIQRSWYTFAEIVTLAPGEAVWVPMPFFHTGGIGPMTAILAQGGVLVTQAHFEPEGIVELIERHRVAHLYSGFPQYSLNVLQHPVYSRERFSFIRSMLNVGPPAMQANIQQLLPEGARLLNLFGMTEGSGIVTFTPWDAPLEARMTTSGKAPAHTEIRIIDPDSGRPSETGLAGEIQFRGGGAFAFYYRDEEATRQTIVDGGWVRTGDRGKMDGEGWLYYLGRLKDMLKVGGENVAAAEIEYFLTEHPGVKMTQVIGVADDVMGEVPVAFVERTPGVEVSAEDLIGMCQGQLAKWKIPRQVHFVTEWPMSSTKVQKFRLRALLEGEDA